MAEALQQFQYSLGRALRDPANTDFPPDIPAERLAIYRELLFNNLRNFTDSCFPVCRSLLGEEQWLALNRDFFIHYRSHTPLFHEIPQMFLDFLQATAPQTTDPQKTAVTLPDWFQQLAHYEWIELYLDTAEQPEPATDGIHFCAPYALLAYDWPVHQISSDCTPSQQQPTFLLVFRDREFQVRFVELNAATFLLLQTIEAQPLSRAALIEALTPHFSGLEIAPHIHQQLDHFIQQQILKESFTS